MVLGSSQAISPINAQHLTSAFISILESNTVNPHFGVKLCTFGILLAEGSMVNQKLSVKILEKYGHTVEITENGSLAVNAFKGQQGKPFDIILVCPLCLELSRHI